MTNRPRVCILKELTFGGVDTSILLGIEGGLIVTVNSKHLSSVREKYVIERPEIVDDLNIVIPVHQNYDSEFVETELVRLEGVDFFGSIVWVAYNATQNKWYSLRETEVKYG